MYSQTVTFKIIIRILTKFLKISFNILFNFRKGDSSIFPEPPIQREYKTKPIYVEKQSSRKQSHDNSKFTTTYNKVTSSNSYTYKSVTKNSRTTYPENLETGYPDNLPRFPRRSKRSTERVVEPDYIRDAEGRSRRVVVFDCGRGTAKCLTITCDIPR
jgi:hypothetical protein